MYSLQKRNVDAENLPKETFIMQKAIRYAFMAAQLQDKFTAYIKLIKNNCNLSNNDNAWLSIDENPEFYEDIRGKISQSALHQLNTGTEYQRQEISHNQKKD